MKQNFGIPGETEEGCYLKYSTEREKNVNDAVQDDIIAPAGILVARS